jgi:hypothetical protein
MPYTPIHHGGAIKKSGAIHVVFVTAIAIDANFHFGRYVTKLVARF